MLTDHAKLVHFFSVAKEVTGRKKLQKMIYILQKNKVPFEEKFQFHFYGPYSEELSLRVEELTNLGFIAEEKVEKKNFHQYNYGITTNGETFLNEFNLDMPDFADKVDRLQGESSRFLELVATMMYFDDFTRDQITDKIHTVKPKQHYTDDEISQAWDLIDNL